MGVTSKNVCIIMGTIQEVILFKASHFLFKKSSFLFFFYL